MQRPKLTKYPFSFVFVVALFTAVRYALEALYVGEVVEYKQLFEIQVSFTSSPLVWLFGDAGGLN